MPPHLAILAGSGALPQAVAQACPEALFVTFSEDIHVPLARHFSARFEKLGALFQALSHHDIEHVVFAGALSRPNPDSAQFDSVTTTIWPRFMAAMARGDDGLLREIIGIFEQEGFRTIGANTAAPELVATKSMSCGVPLCPPNHLDITRGFDVLTALSPHDVAQAVVVEGGQVLGIETLQGTDVLLANVAATAPHLRRGPGANGVFIKTAKKGQELRIDMPVIGPHTVQAVADAGLAGLVIEAGRVMILDQSQVFALVEQLGLFLEVR